MSIIWGIVYSNVPTLLSDHYGMGNISAIHGLTLSAWAIAGLTGNQMAAWIVSHFGESVALLDANGNAVMDHGKQVMVNPTGYQYVLYATIALYIVSLLICLFMVRPTEKALAAKEAKKG